MLKGYTVLLCLYAKVDPVAQRSICAVVKLLINANLQCGKLKSCLNVV